LKGDHFIAYCPILEIKEMIADDYLFFFVY
jgi:hypothetical protein